MAHQESEGIAWQETLRHAASCLICDQWIGECWAPVGSGDAVSCDAVIGFLKYWGMSESAPLLKSAASRSEDSAGP
eukprot:2544577-Amphidinium_carterae.1